MDIKQINPHKYNESLAEALKELDEFKAPEWILFVKSSTHKERPVTEPDFWHKRAASILRQIYINDIVGVQRLRTRYGGRKDRGGKPEKFKRSGGSVIRKILQQADAAELTEQAKQKKAGRKLTHKGKKFLEDVAEKLSKSSGDKE